MKPHRRHLSERCSLPLGGNLIGVAASALAVAAFSAAPSLSRAQSDLPEYQVSSGVSGRITSIGSDTLNNLMTEWSEAFRYTYPAVKAEIQGLGSSTAPPALAQGTSNFAPMSREMKSKEIAAFEKRNGYKPLAIPVAVDTLALFVHADNPVEGLRIDQVDSIFSSTRRCGAQKAAKRWGHVGVEERQWKRKRIRLYGRNSVSGTYGYFKKVALCKGDFSAKVSEQSGSSAVVQAVGRELGGIGYSGIGYRTSQVRVVPLAPAGSDNYVLPSTETAISGAYPLARLLYVYVNKRPDRPLPKLEREFMRMILSAQGQAVVQKNGYIALPADIVEEARERLIKSF